MKIDIITIFPELFETFVNTSIIARAISEQKLEVNICDLRRYSNLPHDQVDDTPYGGGAGMVLMYPPLYRALMSVKQDDSYVIILTPQGVKYTQNVAIDLSHKEHIIIICGRYEGFDERIFQHCDLELSIGDYILMGGEIPAMAVVESVARLIPSVIDQNSVNDDTFSQNLLKYPQYTKPFEFNDCQVPEILISGHHANINKWRLEKSIAKTKQKRPDLYDKYILESKKK